MRKIVFFLIIIFLTSCGSVVKLPVSPVVPAAELTVKKKQDRNNNTKLEVKAKNLSGADRLVPPKHNYSVWIVTKEGKYVNLGRLQVDKKLRGKLKAVTPFGVSELIVTAENEGGLTYPRGTQITYVKFKD
ncbi:MAG: hypothetical protein ACK5KP_04830 [Paludibacteraceae bacterium]